jgi:hypothetical protein
MSADHCHGCKEELPSCDGIVAHLQEAAREVQLQIETTVPNLELITDYIETVRICAAALEGYCATCGDSAGRTFAVQRTTVPAMESQAQSQHVTRGGTP